MANRYAIIDEEFQHIVLKYLKGITERIDSTPPKPLPESEDLLDTADAMAYLKVCRKTLVKYRKKGLPFKKKEGGKIYYWKSEIDKFLKS
jgi:hypothetical protein